MYKYNISLQLQLHCSLSFSFILLSFLPTLFHLPIIIPLNLLSNPLHLSSAFPTHCIALSPTSLHTLPLSLSLLVKKEAILMVLLYFVSQRSQAQDQVVNLAVVAIRMDPMQVHQTITEEAKAEDPLL